MANLRIKVVDKVVDIREELTRRRNIQCAQDDKDWQQVKASNTLAGIELTEVDDELAGRLFRGEITMDQIISVVVGQVTTDKK